MKNTILAWLVVILSIPTLLLPKDDNRSIIDPPCYLTMRVQEKSDESHLMPVGRHGSQVHARNLTLKIVIPEQPANLPEITKDIPVPPAADVISHGLPADIQYRRIRPPIH